MPNDSRSLRRAPWLRAALAITLLSLPLTATAQPRRQPARPAAAETNVQPYLASFRSEATHFIIMDYETGLTLDCHRCSDEHPMPPASMSKLMTVLIVAEALKSGRTLTGRPFTMNTMVPISQNAWEHGATSDGSHMFLAINSQARVRDLLRGVIIVSANDASVALAEAVAGSEAQFVNRMNERAGQLNLGLARFRNATGLPDPDQVMSARALANLARYLIREYPELYRIYSEREFTYNNRTQQNRNPLLERTSRLGEGIVADGMKTGHTNDSGYGLIASATLNGQRRIIVFNGMTSMAARRSEAERMMRAAFFDYTVYRLYAADEEIARANVWLGGADTVPLVSTRPIAVGMPNLQRTGLRAFVRYDGPIAAPIEEGAKIATLVIEGPNFRRREYELVAGEGVGRANWFVQAWAGFTSLFGRPD